DGLRVVGPGDGRHQSDEHQVEEPIGRAAHPARVAQASEEPAEAHLRRWLGSRRRHPCPSLGSLDTPYPILLPLTPSTSTGQDAHSGKPSPWPSKRSRRYISISVRHVHIIINVAASDLSPNSVSTFRRRNHIRLRNGIGVRNRIGLRKSIRLRN